MRKKKARLQKPTRSPLQRAPAQNADRLQTLQSSDQLYRELMNTLQVGVIIHGPGTEILLANPKALEMLGLTQDQLCGKTSLDPDWNVIHEDGTPFPGDAHPSTLAARTLKPVRDVVMGAYHRGTADRVWVQVNATPLLNPNGSLRQVIVTFADISSQKKAEHALRDKEERLRLVLQGGDLGLWDWNLTTGGAVVNRRWLSMYGLDPDAPAPTFEQWQAMLHPDDRQMLQRHFAQVLQERSGAEFQFEFRARHPEGHFIWVHGRGAVVERGPDGRPVRIAGTDMDVSERKQLAEVQRLSHERLNAIINNLPVPIVTLAGKAINFVNAAFVQTFGYECHEFSSVDDWWIRAYPDPEYRQKLSVRWSAELARLQKTGEQFVPIEVTITCKNGTPKTVLASVAAFPESAEGEHVVVLYDLTEHKRAQALQQENDRFQLDAIERFPGMVSYWGRDLRCRMGNAPYSQWFNRTVEQMRGVHQRELLGDDIFNLNKPHLEAVLNGENQQFERIVKKGDGTFANVLVHYVPHKSNGEIPGFFVYVTDVTPIRRDQEQLRTGDIALNSISQGVIIADKDQNITWTNQAFSSITGYALADVLGRNCRLLQGPLTDSLTVDAIRSALRAARDFAGEILNYRKDGTPFWNDLAISPVLDSEGRPSHFVGITRDITERKQALEHKARLEVELQQAQKLESVGRLAGGIAHDFNNLLTVILGHAEIATSRPDVAPPVREAIDEIHKAAMRSAELTRNLLAFARRQTIAPKVLDLNLSISGMRTLLQRLVGPEIDFVCRLNADPALVRLDPSQIDQIVINLCVNAKDAMPAGGRITIETANRTFEEDSASRPDNSLLGSYVSLAITDTGCGMDSQTQTHIFEPFFTTKEVGKGTGLGLATVYGAVTQNGGFIDLVSSPGRGTTFTLYLPLQID